MTTTAKPLTSSTPQHKFFDTLYFRVIVGIVLGVALGTLYPACGEAMKPLGDGFIKLINLPLSHGRVFYFCGA